MMKVMIVDDSRTVRDMVTVALVPAGFEVLHAKDGLDALEQIRQTRDLALVICDLNMPRMGGLQLLEQLRQDQPAGTSPYITPPIIILTTEGRPDVIDRAKRVGARGWLVKPFTPEDLIAITRKLTA